MKMGTEPNSRTSYWDEHYAMPKGSTPKHNGGVFIALLSFMNIPLFLTS